MFKILELSDLFVDACVRDESNNLMFLSVYGRDTAIHQLLAAFHIGRSDGGFDSIRLRDETNGTVHPVSVQRPDRLAKHTGRLPGNMFGNLVHVWVYDPAMLQPDKGSRTAWVFLDEAFGQDSRNRLIELIWSSYKALSPIPLLDSWQEVVLRATEETCLDFMEGSPFPPLGNVTAVRVTIPESLADDISAMVKAGMVGIAGEEARWMDEARQQLKPKWEAA